MSPQTAVEANERHIRRDALSMNAEVRDGKQPEATVGLQIVFA